VRAEDSCDPGVSSFQYAQMSAGWAVMRKVVHTNPCTGAQGQITFARSAAAGGSGDGCSDLLVVGCLWNVGSSTSQV
jgi:hypothetical protein